MKTFFGVFCLVALATAPAMACDICEVFASKDGTVLHRGFTVGAFEQFTHFGTMQDEGNEVANPSRQFEDSSVTQFFVGYQFNSRFGLQLSVPFIHREFRRPNFGSIDSGSESGLVDMALLGKLPRFTHRRGYELALGFDWRHEIPDRR